MALLIPFLTGIADAIRSKKGTTELISAQNFATEIEALPTGGGAYKLITAELPNIDIQILDADSDVVETRNTSASGGTVEFDLTDEGTYTVRALNGDSEVWSKTVTLNETGVYMVKSGKALNDYNWDEIEMAANGHYAKDMWSVGDIKNIGSFMGQTSTTYTNAIVYGFDHDSRSDGQGAVGITFQIPKTSVTYTHRADDVTNGNGISWLGSNIRLNCLKSGEQTYIFDSSVTASTASEDYYKRNPDGTFTAVTLPDEFSLAEKYYTPYTAAEDGVFIAGLSSELKAKIKQVKKKTWGGLGGGKTSSDNTIVETNDWLFIPSDSEVFGDKYRYVNYSKYAAEGAQYEYFRKYRESNFRKLNSLWFRSPSLNAGTSFCCWNSGGYVSYVGAISAFRVALCFCI